MDEFTQPHSPRTEKRPDQPHIQANIWNNSLAEQFHQRQLAQASQRRRDLVSAKRDRIRPKNPGGFLRLDCNPWKVIDTLADNQLFARVEKENEIILFKGTYKLFVMPSPDHDHVIRTRMVLKTMGYRKRDSVWRLEMTPQNESNELTVDNTFPPKTLTDT